MMQSGEKRTVAAMSSDRWGRDLAMEKIELHSYITFIYSHKVKPIVDYTAIICIENLKESCIFRNEKKDYSLFDSFKHQSHHLQHFPLLFPFSLLIISF